MIVRGLFQAATALEAKLRASGFQFCVIGGLALQRWGEPRFTKDIDLALLCRFGDESAAVGRLAAILKSRINDPEAFALEARVYLGLLDDGTPVDIALSALPFEERCVLRASPFEFIQGFPLTTCNAEDLVVMKAFANRPRDWSDLEGILLRQKGRLDWASIREELEPLAAVRDDTTIVSRLEQLRGRCDC